MIITIPCLSLWCTLTGKKIQTSFELVLTRILAGFCVKSRSGKIAIYPNLDYHYISQGACVFPWEICEESKPFS